MAISRFENYDPMLFQSQPMEYTSKLPGDLLLKAGAAQQDRFDKGVAMADKAGDLLQALTPAPGHEDYKAAVSKRYNDQLDAVVQGAKGNYGDATFQRNVVRLANQMANDSDVQKIKISKDFYDKYMSPYLADPRNKADVVRIKNFDNKTKQFTQNTDLYSNLDYTPYQDTGEYLNKALAQVKPTTVDKSNPNLKFTTYTLPDGSTMQTFNTTDKYTRDIVRGRLENVLKAETGTLGILPNNPITRYYVDENASRGNILADPQAVGNQMYEDYKGLIDKYLLHEEKKDVKTTIVPQKSDKDGNGSGKKDEGAGTAPVVTTTSPSSVPLTASKSVADYNKILTDNTLAMQEAVKSGDFKTEKILANQNKALMRTQDEFFKEWLGRNPKEKKAYDAAMAIINSKDKKYSDYFVVGDESNPEAPKRTTNLKEENKKKIEELKQLAFVDGEKFDQYLKENVRSETPTFVSLPGAFATKTSRTEGEEAAMKYVPKDDLVTMHYRAHPDAYIVTDLEGNPVDAKSDNLILMDMQATPSKEGKVVFVASEEDIDNSTASRTVFTKNKYKVIPKDDVTATSVLNQVKEGYKNAINIVTGKDGKPQVKKDDNYNAYLNSLGLDIAKELRDQYNPSAKHYVGSYDLELPNGSVIPISITSGNTNNESKGGKSDYNVEYVDPANKKKVTKNFNTLEEVSREITSLGIVKGAIQWGVETPVLGK